MKHYEDYFSTYRHIKDNNPEAVRWVGIDSTGLAEVIELAMSNGYDITFDFYDEPMKFDANVMIHRRAIIFTKSQNISRTVKCEVDDVANHYNDKTV